MQAPGYFPHMPGLPGLVPCRESGTPQVFCVAFLGAEDAWDRLYGEPLEVLPLLGAEPEGLALMGGGVRGPR